MVKTKIVGIYMIKSNINNKVYIGKSCNVKVRISRHILLLKANRHYNKHLQFSWNKYGEENFTFRVVEVVELHDKQELSRKEIFWIKQYNSYDPFHGYNKTLGGEGALGRKFSKESIEKIRMSLKGKELSSERKENISKSSKGVSRNKLENNPMYGKSLTFEHKDKISKKMKRRKFTNETLEKNSKANKGIKRSEETKAKIREAVKNQKNRKKLIFSDNDIKDIIQMRIVSGLTLSEIGEKYNCSKKPIKRILKEQNIN